MGQVVPNFTWQIVSFIRDLEISVAMLYDTKQNSTLKVPELLFGILSFGIFAYFGIFTLKSYSVTQIFPYQYTTPNIANPAILSSTENRQFFSQNLELLF